jgi:cytochrome c551
MRTVLPPLLVAGAVALLLAGCGGSLEGKFGGELFGVGCAACHGADLSGGTGPDIGPGSNSGVGLSDQQLAGVIRVGPGSMPAYGLRLTAAQIDSLVVYMRLVQRGPGDP